MPDLFMSYSRKDKEFVKQLVAALKTQNRDVWVDWEDIPLTADWLQEIYKGIEGANNFIFIITPDSVASEVCGQELTHAIENNKRLVPVLRREVTDYKLLHGALSSHNWIYMRENDNFDEAFKGLTTALDTDLDHVHAHTRLLERAKEWADKQFNHSFLLRGVDLQDGEKWLSGSANKQPRATELQSKYIFESRGAETRRQRTLLMSVAAALVVSLVLLIFAVYQTIQSQLNAQRADLNAQFALARQLAAQSATRLDSELDLALLLSLEANAIADEVGLGGGEVRGTLLNALQYSPYLFTYFHGNGTAAKGISLSPDGQILASAHLNGEILLSAITTHTIVSQFQAGDATRADAVSFHPNGSILATGGNNNNVFLWDVSDPAQPQMIGGALTGHEASVIGVIFNTDGTLLVSGSGDGQVILWNVSDPTAPTQLGAFLFVDGVGLRDMALSHDGRFWAGAGDDTNVYLWNIADRTNPELVRVLEGHRGAVETVAFNNDQTLLASGGDDRDILLWDMSAALDLDLESVQPITRLSGHTNFVIEVAFSPNGSLLASGGADEIIMLWEMETVLDGTIDVRDVPRLAGHSNWINGLVFKPSSQALISASDDANLIVWDINQRQQIGDTLQGHTNEVLGVAYSPDGRLVVSGSLDNTLRLWDAQTRESIGQPFGNFALQVESVAFSPNSQLVVSTSGDNENAVVLWDVSDPTNPTRRGDTLEGHAAGALTAVFSPDGTLLASAGSAAADAASPILLWDVSDPQNPTLLATLQGHTGFLKALAFSPDGSLLASSGRDRQILLWDMNRESDTFGQIFGEPLTGHTRSIMALAFSPDGRTLASGSLDETVRLWDVQTRQAVFEPIHNHTWFVYTLSFSPDGALLASGSADQTIILLDMVTFQQIGRPLRGHTDSVRGIAFSPDGRHLASSSEDHSIVIWDVVFDDWRARACELVNRNLTDFEWQEFVGEGSAPAVCP
jgi:WD40 repeat protein